MTDLAKKLQLREGMRGAVIGRPSGLALRGIGGARGERLDYVIVFLRRAADVEGRAVPALDRLREDGLAWFCYPKKSSPLYVDLSRDEGWESLLEAGYRGVRQIAIDDVWSALRFRRRERVG